MLKFLLIFLFSIQAFGGLEKPFRSAKNVSQTILVDGTTWTGEWENCESFTNMKAAVLADAAGTLFLQQSSDKTTAQSSLSYAVTASVNEVHGLEVTRKWCRLSFADTSDGTTQTSFDISMMLGYGGHLVAPANLSQGLGADAILTRSVSMELDIARGKRSGIILIQKFGHNPDIDTGTVPEDVWHAGGTYTGFPSERELVEVLSSSVADASAGTGCRTVYIEGLDTNFVVQSETVTLNGTTPVDSVGTYSRLNRAYCVTAGSGTVNAGTITIRHTTTTANVFATIDVGKGQTEVACYTTPAGYTGYIKSLHYDMFDTNANRASIAFFIKFENGTTRLIRPHSVSTSSPHDVHPYGFLAFPEKTDGCGRVLIVDNSNANVNFSFEMLLIKN